MSQLVTLLMHEDYINSLLIFSSIRGMHAQRGCHWAAHTILPKIEIQKTQIMWT